VVFGLGFYSWIGVGLAGFLLSCWWEYLFPFAGRNWWAMLNKFISFISAMIFGLFVAGGCVGVLESPIIMVLGVLVQLSFASFILVSRSCRNSLFFENSFGAYMLWFHLSCVGPFLIAVSRPSLPLMFVCGALTWPC